MHRALTLGLLALNWGCVAPWAPPMAASAPQAPPPRPAGPPLAIRAEDTPRLWTKPLIRDLIDAFESQGGAVRTIALLLRSNWGGQRTTRVLTERSGVVRARRLDPLGRSQSASVPVRRWRQLTAALDRLALRPGREAMRHADGLEYVLVDLQPGGGAIIDLPNAGLRVPDGHAPTPRHEAIELVRGTFHGLEWSPWRYPPGVGTRPGTRLLHGGEWRFAPDRVFAIGPDDVLVRGRRRDAAAPAPEHWRRLEPDGRIGPEHPSPETDDAPPALPMRLGRWRVATAADGSVVRIGETGRRFPVPGSHGWGPPEAVYPETGELLFWVGRAGKTPRWLLHAPTGRLRPLPREARGLIFGLDPTRSSPTGLGASQVWAIRSRAGRATLGRLDRRLWRFTAVLDLDGLQPGKITDMQVRDGRLYLLYGGHVLRITLP